MEDEVPRRLSGKSNIVPATPEEQDSRPSAPDPAAADTPDDAQRGVTRTTDADVEHVVYAAPPASNRESPSSSEAPPAASDAEPLSPSAEPPQPEFDRYGNLVQRDPPGGWRLRFDLEPPPQGRTLNDWDPFEW
jgi:hypothetical protein